MIWKYYSAKNKCHIYEVPIMHKCQKCETRGEELCRYTVLYDNDQLSGLCGDHMISEVDDVKLINDAKELYPILSQNQAKICETMTTLMNGGLGHWGSLGQEVKKRPEPGIDDVESFYIDSLVYGTKTEDSIGVTKDYKKINLIGLKCFGVRARNRCVCCCGWKECDYTIMGRACVYGICRNCLSKFVISHDPMPLPLTIKKLIMKRANFSSNQ